MSPLVRAVFAAVLVAAVAVAGDTASDIGTGLAAGAGLVAGVLSGAHDRATLEAAGAHVVLDDVTGLREPIGLPAVAVA